MCPTLTQCPDGTVDIYSTFPPAVELFIPNAASDDDDGNEVKASSRTSNLIPQDEPSALVADEVAEESTGTTKSLSKRSVAVAGKRSVPELDDDDSLNTFSTPQHPDFSNDLTPNDTTLSALTTENSTLIQQCCTQSQCVCDTSLCATPRCESGLVAIVLNSDVGRPGNCCPVFKCTHVPNCTDVNVANGVLWRENCRSCICFNQTAECTSNNCLATRNETISEINQDQINLDHPQLAKDTVDCFSTIARRSYVNGSKWVDGECTDCQCLNGEISCHASVCRPIECPKFSLAPGECCSTCDNFCKGHEYCNKYCFDGYAVDAESGCQKCECMPRKTTKPILIVVPNREGATTTEQPSISGIAPTPTSSTNPNESQSTPEPKPSVQINIINNNYHHNSTVAEQDQTGRNYNMIVVGMITFAIGLVIGCLAGLLYMRSRQKKQQSYSTVPSYDSNANAIILRA